LRFTRRGGPDRDGADAPAPSATADSAADVSRGGVRLDRFGGGFGRGMSLRVTIPCPVVQRFVVSQ
jgi:hypothetical protein